MRAITSNRPQPTTTAARHVATDATCATQDIPKSPFDRSISGTVLQADYFWFRHCTWALLLTMLTADQFFAPSIGAASLCHGRRT